MGNTNEKEKTNFALAWKVRVLRPDLLVLPHFEPEAAQRGLPANGYALLWNQQAILVDTVFEDTLPSLRALVADGNTPVALVLTHRHVAAQAEVLPEILAQFQIPVFLHPRDASHPQAKRWRHLAYANPLDSLLLTQHGVEVISFPGHTEGHIMLYRGTEGGLLLTGDCAVGPSVQEASAGNWTFVRPPFFFNVDETALQRGWQAFDRSVATLGPYHGLPLVSHPEATQAALNSLRSVELVTDLRGG